MTSHNEQEKPQTALIREQLRRSFQEKASEDLPADLMTLINQLKEQDTQNGK
ncbi:NepR family anti-sigma factor [Pararhodobacter oceanensis]|uniref:NepR family anti-sigma factor n=1 Tax=Pararhodobacter oceanensis TaxID=2172121 RepID=UPI001402A2C1|nr:NepR family anti-sigma factor [Pararhodobacter oceanensis]